MTSIGFKRNKQYITMASSKKEAIALMGNRFTCVGVYKYERNPIKGHGNHFYEFKFIG